VIWAYLESRHSAVRRVNQMVVSPTPRGRGSQRKTIGGAIKIDLEANGSNIDMIYGVV
jgi:hypothetical protein